MTREEAGDWLVFYNKKPAPEPDGRFAWFSTAPLTNHLPAEWFGELKVAGMHFDSEQEAYEWAITKLMERQKGETP